MKTRDLQFPFETESSDQALANRQEIVEFHEIGQHPRMYQQGRLANAGVLLVQKHQLRTKVIQQTLRGPLFADAIADPAAFVDGLGKWAQFQANYRSLQP